MIKLGMAMRMLVLVVVRGSRDFLGYLWPGEWAQFKDSVPRLQLLQLPRLASSLTSHTHSKSYIPHSHIDMWVVGTWVMGHDRRMTGSCRWNKLRHRATSMDIGQGQ